MIEVTIALPTWNSASIVWLQLESLIRQRTDVEWELVMSECERLDALDVLRDYWHRLAEAGCVHIEHIYNRDRMPLGLKWRQIARKAKGGCLVLAASDNYSPPDRIQRAYEVIIERGFVWADTSKGLFYHIPSGKQGTWVRQKKHLSGLWMACRTDHLKQLDDSPPPRNIDGWIKRQLPDGFRWHQEVAARAGIHTDGMNTISHHRAYRYLQGPTRPFIPATQDARQILPRDVLERLECRETCPTAE